MNTSTPIAGVLPRLPNEPTLAAIRSAIDAELAEIIAFLRSGQTFDDDRQVDELGYTIEDYNVPLDALAFADPSFAAVYVTRGGRPRRPERHATTPADHCEMIALSYVYIVTLRALKEEGRRFRPTVDAIVAKRGCDRQAAKNEIARTLRDAAVAEPETLLVTLYDKAFPETAH